MKGRMIMDNDRFERRQRVYSTAKITGLLAGSAAAFIAFCLFQIFGAEILETAGVAVTPGIDFDPVRGARTLRFSYARSTADIAEGLDRLARWMAAR